MTLIEVKLETGRTHQIRVQMSESGHAVVGDPMYGSGWQDEALGVPALGRQFLHARRLAFLHPVTNEALAFEVPLPEDLETFLGRVRR